MYTTGTTTITTDTTAANKQRIEAVFARLAEGDGRALVEAMADDFCWHIPGSTAWSGSYRGKQAVREQLLAPLMAQFADRYTSTASRIVADGDVVVVETQGRVTTRTGKPYHNRYCLVIRMHEGQMKELTEYMDTALVDSALAPPPHPPAHAHANARA
jgi:ketosteroid isomerase-like protein